MMHKKTTQRVSGFFEQTETRNTELNVRAAFMYWIVSFTVSILIIIPHAEFDDNLVFVI